MKKIIVLCLMILLLATSVLSLNLEEELTKARPEIEGQKLAGTLGTLFGDEKVNIYIKMVDDSSSNVGLEIKDKVITKLVVGKLDKPTINVFMTEDVLINIANSQDPLPVVRKALKDKELIYRGVGFFKRMKFGMSGFLVKMLLPDEEVKEGPAVKSVPLNEKKEIKEVKEEKKEVKEEVKEEKEKKKEDKETLSDGLTGAVTKVIDDPDDVTLHEVQLVKTGFSRSSITVNVGDTVEWTNTRTSNPSKGMLIGTQKCRKIKSGSLSPGDSYGYTFTEPQRCVVVDAFMTTQAMTVVVE